MKGNCILGYNHFLSKCTSFEEKLWGIVDGILIILEKGYRRATIQTDNLEVISALTEKNMENSGITVLQRIRRLMRFEGK